MKKFSLIRKSRGFTLVETVIAIGVLAVLLTGFVIVFAPAAAGIKKSINVQEADRLASTLEQELATSRGTEPTPGFSKAFQWIKESNSANNALLVYQYRGSLTEPLRDDGTPKPEADVSNKVAGKDFAVLSMVRRKGDAKFTADLPAVEGGVYLVKCTQLVFQGGELKPGNPGAIRDPKGTAVSQTADDYPEAVIAFAAEFHALPGKSEGFFGVPFTKFFNNAKNPVFTRNLAVRR